MQNNRKTLVKILTTILWVVHVIAWVTVVFAGIGSVFLFFAVPVEGFINSFENADVDISHGLGDLISMTMAFIDGLMFLLVSRRLIDVLRSLKDGTPFESANANRFSVIGRVVVYAELAKITLLIVGGFIAVITPLVWGEDIDINLTLTNWLGAGIALVLAEVFREGARLREDQELTI